MPDTILDSVDTAVITIEKTESESHSIWLSLRQSKFAQVLSPIQAHRRLE